MIKSVTLRVEEVRPDVSDSTIGDCVRNALFWLEQIGVNAFVQETIVNDYPPRQD